MENYSDTRLQEVLRPLGEPFRQHLVELRRWLHQHPELSYQEAETAKRIIQELEAVGIQYEYAGVGHAVIGHIDGQDPSAPAIALRADMDALPGDETTGAAYTSVNPGVMHACGHCAHMAMLVGAAKLLSEDSPPGPVRLVFQPAEERGAGARIAIEDGALDNVAMIFGAHVNNEYETGRIMVRDADVTAQSDTFSICIRGKGGHGARPHEATDAVVISGFLITALQTLVSREINPLHPSVITIGSVHAGSAPNVIAENAELHGTIRTSLPEARGHIHHGLQRMISAAAELHNCDISIDINEGYPPVLNDPRAATIARRAAADIVGQDAVFAAEYPSMGAEDFSFYLAKVPGCFVRFGTRKTGEEPVPLHSPAFDIDERALGVGARFFDRVAREAFAHLDDFPDAV